MKILITGGCGFIGSNLSIYLKNKGFKVYSLDNLLKKESKHNSIRLKQHKIKNFNIDIANKKKLLSLKIRFDLIIDCSAEPSVNKSFQEIDRVLYTNFIGTFNILKKCSLDKAKLIFLSSSRVYSLNFLRKVNLNKKIKKKINLKKTFNILSSTDGPKSIYGFTKYASEELIREFSYLNNLKFIINRLGVVSGPWQIGKVDQGFLSLWVWHYLQKKKLNYIGYGGYGHQVRDILHISDLCNLIFLQIKKINSINNVRFTVGGGLKNAISLKTLSNICENVIGNKIRIGKVTKTNIYDVPYYVSSNRTISKIYLWKPIKSIKNIVIDVFKWQKENFSYLKKINK